MRCHRLILAMQLALCVVGCRSGSGPAPAHEDSWAVTAWGERYEVFAETGPLVAGESASSNAHVTVLEGFSPLTSGSVSAMLRASGRDETFRQDRPKRDGIYPVEVRPSSEGTYELLFEVDGPAGREEIPAGRVRVGSAASPGGAIADESAASGNDAIAFLKEQQWRTSFATAPIREAQLNESVAGPARVTPSAGGEVTLTATFNASVAPDPWP
jgi:hypothetical protein